MIVVLDTTALVADRFLESNDMRLLLAASRDGTFRVAVTEVSLLEAINKVRENAAEALGSVRSGMESLRRLRALPVGLITDVSEDSVATTYEAIIRREFEQSKVEVLELPAVGHRPLLERALERRKPFDSAGRVGYRDALIWETIVALAAGASGEIAFISANHRDFAESGKGSGLARSLASELNDAGARVELFDDLASFLDRYVQPAKEALAEVKALLEGESESRTKLLRAIEAAVDRNDADTSGIRAAELVSDVGFADYELEEVRLKAVSPGVSHIEVSRARTLEPDQVLLELEAEADADVEYTAYVMPWRAAGLSSSGAEELDGSTGGTRSGGTTLTLRLAVEATYRPSLKTVEDLRVVSASSLVDPDADRLASFRRYRAGAHARDAWQQQAAEAVAAWAESQGYPRPTELGRDALDFRGESGPLLVELVADPEMTTWLRAAVGRLAMLGEMIGDDNVRRAIVLPRPISALLFQQVVNALDMPIEIYVLAEGEVRPHP